MIMYKELLLITFIWCFGFNTVAQKTPSGNPADFKVKTCLHSVSYAGFWRGQARLTVDEFLIKAKELGYEGVMLVAKRPHVSPHDYDQAARARLKAKIDSLGLTLVALAGYTDYTAGIDKPGTPMLKYKLRGWVKLQNWLKTLGTDMVRILTGTNDQTFHMINNTLK